MTHPNSLAALRPRRPGDPSLNPGGKPPQLVSTALRRLISETEILDGQTEVERARCIAETIWRRAMDPNRKDAVLWMRVLLERAEGPVKDNGAAGEDVGAWLTQFMADVRKKPAVEAEDAEFREVKAE